MKILVLYSHYHLIRIVYREQEYIFLLLKLLVLPDSAKILDNYPFVTLECLFELFINKP